MVRPCLCDTMNRVVLKPRVLSNVDEDLILATANQMVTLGLQAAGYNHINLGSRSCFHVVSLPNNAPDDCWALKNRSNTGDLVPDPAKFPDGAQRVTCKSLLL